MSADAESLTEWTAAAIEHAATDLDRVRGYEVRVVAAITQLASDVAVVEGLKLLRLLGVHIPDKPKTRHIVGGLMAIKALLAFRRVESLAKLPTMTDEIDLTRMRLLQVVTQAAYSASPNVFAMAVVQSVLLVDPARQFAVRHRRLPQLRDHSLRRDRGRRDRLQIRPVGADAARSI